MQLYRLWWQATAVSLLFGNERQEPVCCGARVLFRPERGLYHKGPDRAGGRRVKAQGRRGGVKLAILRILSCTHFLPLIFAIIKMLFKSNACMLHQKFFCSLYS